MVAPAAILRCVGWIDFDGCSSSFFRFGEQLLKKSRPTRIVNALSKTMVMNHPVHVKVFDADHTKTVDDLPGLLMREVLPSELDTFVNPCHNLTVLAPLRCTFCQLGMLAVNFSKGFFFLSHVCALYPPA